ncbi:MAG: hemerythrin domain-containing protein [Bryobacteraceae bacterium]
MTTEASRQQHRAMERHLDDLLSAIEAGAGFLESFRKVHSLAAEHYGAEEELLREIARHEAALAGKMAAQHAEALEMAAALEEVVAAGHADDALRLARRFHAVAQHNIIEEERDVFPLAERWDASGSGFGHGGI